MPDRLKAGTPAWNDRQRRHRHNGFLGHTTMAQKNMDSIIDSPTATDEAKEIASQIRHDLYRLRMALKVRIDA